MQSSDLKASIQDTIRSHTSATRSQVNRRVRVGVLIGYGASLLLFVAVGAVRLGPRPLSMVAGTVLGAALGAILASWSAIGRGDEMSGRTQHTLVWTVVATPLVLFGWQCFWDAQFAPLDWHTPGLRCFALMHLFAVGPLMALCYLRRGVDPVHPRLLGAAFGIAGAAYANVLVELWCPSAEVCHLLLGHAAPFAILSIVGARLGGVSLASH